MKAFFFDMDGVLLDSMYNHARAWEAAMTHHGLRFSQRDCFINEGRTGMDVIYSCSREQGVPISDEEAQALYDEKTVHYLQLGGGVPMPGMAEVLHFLQVHHFQIWVVTGGGQNDLYEQLERAYPGVFARERMITAHNVTHGKPNPEPYLKAWQACGLAKEDCYVVENAPLGVRAGHGAGLFTIAVNTGPLEDQRLWDEGAQVVLSDMSALLQWLEHTF